MNAKVVLVHNKDALGLAFPVVAIPHRLSLNGVGGLVAGLLSITVYISKKRNGKKTSNKCKIIGEELTASGKQPKEGWTQSNNFFLELKS